MIPFCYSSHKDLMVEYKHSDNILINVHMTNATYKYSWVPYNVWTIHTVKDYQLFKHLPCCDCILLDRKNLFLEDYSTFIWKDGV